MNSTKTKKGDSLIKVNPLFWFKEEVKEGELLNYKIKNLSIEEFLKEFSEVEKVTRGYLLMNYTKIGKSKCEDNAREIIKVTEMVNVFRFQFRRYLKKNNMDPFIHSWNNSLVLLKQRHQRFFFKKKYGYKDLNYETKINETEERENRIYDWCEENCLYPILCSVGIFIFLLIIITIVSVVAFTIFLLTGAS